MRRQLTIGFLLLRSDLFHFSKDEAVLETDFHAPDLVQDVFGANSFQLERMLNLSSPCGNLWLGASSWAQSATASLTTVEDFPVRVTLSIKPAPTPRTFGPITTSLVHGLPKARANGSNSAGHYTIAEWGVPVLTYEGKYSPNTESYRPLAYQFE